MDLGMYLANSLTGETTNDQEVMVSWEEYSVRVMSQVQNYIRGCLSVDGMSMGYRRCVTLVQVPVTNRWQLALGETLQGHSEWLQKRYPSPWDPLK